MPFNETLVSRLRKELSPRTDIEEKKMFGGLSFMLAGNMCCGVVGDDLVVRVGPVAYDAALSRPAAREMDFTGRALRGFVYVAAENLADAQSLTEWVNLGVAFAASLPAK